MFGSWNQGPTARARTYVCVSTDDVPIFGLAGADVSNTTNNRQYFTAKSWHVMVNLHYPGKTLLYFDWSKIII